MDIILTIFKSLGVDQTVFIQAGLLIVIFSLVSTLLFKKLQEVLELRETKTVKLESTAHAVYKQAEELAEQFKARVEKTHQESHSQNQKKRSDLNNSEKDKLKKAEAEFTKEYEEQRSKNLRELAEQRSKLLSKIDELSGNLVDKLTK